MQMFSKLSPLNSIMLYYHWGCIPYHLSTTLICAVASRVGLGWSGVVSAALVQLVALILGACGVWCAKFVIYQ